MKIADLLKLHEETCAQARDVMRAKNHDYTGDADDPFANFRASAVIGVQPVLGILMRMMDKFKRVETYVKLGDLAVNDESVEDSLDDCINYIILAKGMVREQQEERAKNVTSQRPG